MNLTLYFRLIVSILFQPRSWKSFNNEPMSYDNTFFFCPKVVAKDGFAVSLQIHNGSYCQSENGYRTFGLTWKEVEFGFPTMNAELMFQYSEMWSDAEDKDTFDVTNTVGKIPIEVIEEVFTKHGGIDWEQTLSEDKMKEFLHLGN